MKRIIFILYFACCATFLFVSCEGPMGALGIDGVDGEDGDVTCLSCHADEKMQSVQFQFGMSSHCIGAVDAERDGWDAGCVQCHTSEGFIDYATNGMPEAGLSTPSGPFECKTCHGLHSTFDSTDYALRLTEPVAFIYSEDFTTPVTADFGTSNLCANCHQSRRPEPNFEVPGTTFYISSTHYGPHHGSHVNVLAGVGFAEIAGTASYPTAGSAVHMTQANCASCHMSDFSVNVNAEGDDEGQGGHSFRPNLDACNSCHGVAETDFDHGDFQTETEAQLLELRDLLVAQGVVEQAMEDIWEINQTTGINELVTYAGDYHPVKGTFTMVQAQAFYNWVGLEEDRSLGAHNPLYVKALLTNSIAALGGK
ncbi:MAG: hypothetical protein JXR51_04535 [Bacteroidales bacterium]|nr:hypothetical protein [Bacteroidales bacterium]